MQISSQKPLKFQQKGLIPAHLSPTSKKQTDGSSNLVSFHILIHFPHTCTASPTLNIMVGRNDKGFILV